MSTPIPSAEGQWTTRKGGHDVCMLEDDARTTVGRWQTKAMEGGRSIDVCTLDEAPPRPANPEAGPRPAMLEQLAGPSAEATSSHATAPAPSTHAAAPGPATHAAAPAPPTHAAPPAPSTRAAAPGPPTHAATPALLQGDVLEALVPYLAPDARLALSWVTKDMTDLLIKYAPATHLTLRPTHTSAAALSTAQQRAAQSNKVTLSLYGGVITPDACLWGRVDALHLHELTVVTEECWAQLQALVRSLPRLHTLSFDRCNVYGTFGGVDGSGDTDAGSGGGGGGGGYSSSGSSGGYSSSGDGDGSDGDDSGSGRLRGGNGGSIIGSGGDGGDGGGGGSSHKGSSNIGGGGGGSNIGGGGDGGDGGGGGSSAKGGSSIGGGGGGGGNGDGGGSGRGGGSGGEGGGGGDGGDCGSVNAAASAPNVRTLRCMGGLDCLKTALSLVDPAQLQTLITDDKAVVRRLPQLPSLQELQLLPKPRPHGYGFMMNDMRRGGVDDRAFQQLLKQDDIKRVALPNLDLRYNFTGHQCGWESLCLAAGVHLSDLSRMPLARIRTCVVRDWLGDWVDRGSGGATRVRALTNMKACPDMVFEPGVQRCNWRPAEPTFGVGVSRSSSQHAGKMLSMVLSKHRAGSGALAINAGERLLDPALLACLAEAPASLTTLCFDVEDVFEFLRWKHLGLPGVITHVPSHVTHVVLVLLYELPLGCMSMGRGSGPPAVNSWLECLPCFVRGVWRPLRLTLVGGRDCPRWSAGDRQAVLGLMATLVGDDVRVEFQNKYADEEDE